jgi:hypothetical protein
LQAKLTMMGAGNGRDGFVFETLVARGGD